MAFKWTKASRAKLSRSQKARWKERKRQQSRKRPKRNWQMVCEGTLQLRTQVPV